MPLESAQTIAELDERWPRGNETASQGDDHLRMLKAVLKNQFPGASGNGWDEPLTVDVSVLNNIFSAMKPVGTVELRMDAINPNALYGGTWELITGDASLSFGDGSVQTGVAVGQNDVQVNIPSHKHTINGAAHEHTRGTMEITGELQGISEGFGETGYAIGAFQMTDRINAHTYDGQDTSKSGSADFKASRTWSGKTSTALSNLETESVGATGEQAKTNVRGARIAINVWQKVAD